MVPVCPLLASVPGTRGTVGWALAPAAGGDRALASGDGIGSATAAPASQAGGKPQALLGCSDTLRAHAGLTQTGCSADMAKSVNFDLHVEFFLCSVLSCWVLEVSLNL